jgi:hypothetical protein
MVLWYLHKTGDTNGKKGMTYIRKNGNKNLTPLRDWGLVKTVADEGLKTLHI